VAREIARRGKASAENCGRSECHLQDMLCAIQTLLGLKLKDLREHMTTQRSTGFPFARGSAYSGPVPICREVPWRTRRETGERREEEEQIPEFFPPFPPAHTFTYTPVEVTRIKDNPAEKADLASEKRALEDRLATLLAQDSSPLPASGPEPQPNPFLSAVHPASQSFLDSL
jgi:hypothetical protein